MKIVVIGGGAAGFFAAIHAAENGAKVQLLEKSNKLLAKVKVSGGGRCNVTNSCDDPALLVNNYPRGGKELRGPFSRFHTLHTCEWFESRGVQLKTEPDGRMFPESNSSQAIIDCLHKAASVAGVDIRTGVAVKSISRAESGFDLETTTGKIFADKVIVATGGSPQLSSYEWLSSIGHQIITPVPSLFTFNTPGSSLLELMGISVQMVRIKIADSKFTEEGPLLFTHWGLSGPAVLKLSAWAARWLNEQNFHFRVTINFFPHLTEVEVRELLQLEFEKNSNKKIVYSNPLLLPSRLWEMLCHISGISTEQKWAGSGKSVINKLITNLTSLTLPVAGKTTFKEEFVTCGGVNLKEVNMRTMESRKVPGLFFAGEVLDIDGITGGFNFQAAWTTGFIAGKSSIQS